MVAMTNALRRNTMAGFAVVATLALCGSGCAAVGSGTASRAGTGGPAAVADPPGYLRVVRTADRSWSVECINDPCSTSPRFSVNVPTPQGVTSFDLVLTVTMQYTTTPKDWAEASVFFCPYANPPPPCAFLLLEPGRFPIAPAATGGGGTATLTWSGKGMSAGYKAWHYELLVTPYDGSGDRAVTVTGHLVTAVFDMRPSSA